MKMSFNKKIIAANWKMNKNTEDSVEFINKLRRDVAENIDSEIIVFPSAISLEKVSELCKNSNIIVGAQNCHWESSGAFTGEISVEMIKSVGAKYVLVGHSERRNYFLENDETINKKIKKVVSSGLMAVLCIGENFEQHLKSLTKNILETQLKSGLNGVSFEDLKNIVIAYEPVWAIGTGKAVEPNEADEIGEFIKNIIFNEFGANIPVIYGGSVNLTNAVDLLSLKNIDGVLIGGASLDEKSLSKIIKIANGVK